MNLPLLPRLPALFLSFSLAALAVEEKKDAAASGADAAWAEIEKELHGPAEKPKSQEEAAAMMKAHLLRIDQLGADFTAKHPADPRWRWRIATQIVTTYPIREGVGLPPKNMADARKILHEVIEAPDVDPETRSEASFRMVLLFAEEMRAGNLTLADFQKAVDAHISAYPKFKGNEQLNGLIAGARAEQELKAKPIELKFTAVDGREVDLAKMRGKVVLVDFWATWCGPCVAEIPKVVRAHEQLHAAGFEIVGISFDEDRAKLESMTAEKRMTWPQHFDGKGWKNEFGEKFGIQSIPRMWLVDKKGMVVDTEARTDLAAKVGRLLAE